MTFQGETKVVHLLEELVPALQVRLQQDVVVLRHAGLQVPQQTPHLEQLAGTLLYDGRGPVWLRPHVRDRRRVRLKNNRASLTRLKQNRQQITQR